MNRKGIGAKRDVMFQADATRPLRLYEVEIREFRLNFPMPDQLILKCAKYYLFSYFILTNTIYIECQLRNIFYKYS